MMRDETDNILDDLLSRWHAHCRGFNPAIQAASPMFRHALRAKGEQTLEAISEDAHWDGVFKALDFHVGEMPDTQEKRYRTAIYINARNCYTGRNVWISPRLPSDPQVRAEIVRAARFDLMQRLVVAGVM